MLHVDMYWLLSSAYSSETIVVTSCLDVYKWLSHKKMMCPTNIQKGNTFTVHNFLKGSLKLNIDLYVFKTKLWSPLYSTLCKASKWLESFHMLDHSIIYSVFVAYITCKITFRLRMHVLFETLSSQKYQSNSKKRN